MSSFAEVGRFSVPVPNLNFPAVGLVARQELTTVAHGVCLGGADQPRIPEVGIVTAEIFEVVAHEDLVGRLLLPTFAAFHEPAEFWGGRVDAQRVDYRLAFQPDDFDVWVLC